MDDGWDAERLAVEQLDHVWSKLNQGLFRGALRQPTIRLADFVWEDKPNSPTTEWRTRGTFYPNTSTIELGRHLFNDIGPETAERLCGVMLHEMIHQWVWEVGASVVSRKSHGGLFLAKANELAELIPGRAAVIAELLSC